MSQSQREVASAWVNGYTAIAVAFVLPVSLIPGAATGILITQEAIMAYHIGLIYKSDFSKEDGKVVALQIGLAAVTGNIVALELAILTGPFAMGIKPVIAGTIVKILGEAIIDHFDEKWG
jgi:hypothetical protein